MFGLENLFRDKKINGSNLRVGPVKLTVPPLIKTKYTNLNRESSEMCHCFLKKKKKFNKHSN